MPRSVENAPAAALAVANEPLAGDLSITALVERGVFVIWGARQLGEARPLPAKVDQQYAGGDESMRQN
jgi:hypothetical protein